MITALEALERLRTGNQRFVANLNAATRATQGQLSSLTATQEP